MITSAKQKVRFTPRDLCDENGKPLDGAPVYFIKAPTPVSRAEWRRALSDAGARQVTRSDLVTTLKRGIKEIVEAEQQEELLAFVDEFEAVGNEVDEIYARLRQMSPKDAEEGTPELIEAVARQHEMTGKMDDIESQMRRMYPPYARKLSEQTFWLETAPIMACHLFLAGWENVDAEFKRGYIVPDEVMMHIPRDHIAEIGWHAITLTSAAGQAKNSVGPSSSASKPKRSARTRKARGTSSAK